AQVHAGVPSFPARHGGVDWLPDGDSAVSTRRTHRRNIEVFSWQDDTPCHGRYLFLFISSSLYRTKHRRVVIVFGCLGNDLCSFLLGHWSIIKTCARVEFTNVYHSDRRRNVDGPAGIHRRVCRLYFSGSQAAAGLSGQAERGRVKLKMKRFDVCEKVFRFQAWTIPVALLVMTFLAYGLFALQQGFHWDDWGFAWMPVTYGLPGLVKYYSYDRPFLAYFVYLTTSLLGPHPFAWQIFGLLARWASAVTLWWVIRITLPNCRRLAFWTSAFFLLYPGFRQQTIANAYGHYLWIETCFFISLAFMMKAVESNRYRWPLILASFILTLPNLFLTEYFAGFEIVRPFLLWFALRKENLNTLQHIKRFALYYLPFVFIFAAFLYWRFFVARSLRYGIDVISPTEVASMTTLSELIATILDQWLTVSINAWLQIFQLPSLQDFGMRLMLLHSLILIAVLESWVYFSKQLTHSEEINSHVNSRLLILRLWLIVGFIAVLGAQIPFL